MEIPASIESFQFSGEQLEAFVPSAQWVQAQYQLEKAAGNDPLFPYWAQGWPAAKALCEMIAKHPVLVKNKTIVELAAGIGLPSLLSARFAKGIISSDYISDATEVIKRSVTHNNIHNIQTEMIDWNNLPTGMKADVLLLSDINYDPASFDTLYRVLGKFINEGSTLLLSTPQRLAGKAFMERLQPWCIQQEEIPVLHNEEMVYTNVWILKN